MQIKKNAALKALLIKILTGKKKLNGFHLDVFNLNSFIAELKIADKNIEDLDKLKITDLILFFLQYIYASLKRNNNNIISEIFKNCDVNLLTLFLTALPLLFNLIIEKMSEEAAQPLKKMHDIFCDFVFSKGSKIEKEIGNNLSKSSLFDKAFYYCFAHSLKLKNEQKDSLRAIKIFEELDAVDFKAATYQLLCLYDPFDTSWSIGVRDINQFSQIADKLIPLTGERYCLAYFNLARMYQHGYKNETGTIYQQVLSLSVKYYLDLYLNIHLNVFPELQEIFSQSLKFHALAQEIYIYLNKISYLNNNNVDIRMTDVKSWTTDFNCYRSFLETSQTKKLTYKNYEPCVEEGGIDEMPRYIPLQFYQKNSKKVVLFGCIESVEVRNIIPINKEVNENASRLFVSALCYHVKHKAKNSEDFILIKYLELLDKLNSHNLIEMKIPEIPQKTMNPCAPNFYPSSSFNP